MTSPNEHLALLVRFNDLVVGLDDEGIVRHGDARGPSGLGHEPSTLVGREFVDLIHPQDREEWGHAIAKATSGESDQRVEIRFGTAMGEWRWVEAALSDERDGDIAMIVAACRDITENKAREQTVANKLSRAEAIVDNSRDVVLISDPDGVAIYVSPSVRDFGYEPEELLGTVPFDFIHPDDTDAAWDRFTRAVDDPEAAGPLELRVRHGDGTWRWVESLGTNLIDDPAVGGIVSWFRDISERKEAADLLRANEERFEAVAGNSSDVLMVIDSAGMLAWVSASVKTTFGYQPDDLIDREATGFVHPDDLEEAAAGLAWLTGEPRRTWTATWRIRHADGTWRYAETAHVNLLDHPAVGGIAASCRDITNRRRTEVALRESEARFRAVIQNGRDVTGLLDPSGGFVWVSPNIEDMLGHAPADLEGTSSLDLVHPDDLPLALERLGAVIESTVPVDPVDLRIQRSDGFWQPVEIAGGSLRNDAREVEGVIINVRDTAWRIEAEAALRASEQRFRALVQNSSDLVTVTDIDGTVTYVSPAVERLFDRRPDEVLGHNASSFIHPDDLDRVTTALSTTVAHPKQPTTSEYRVMRADGAERWVEVTATSLLDDDAVGGIVHNIRDITDRVAAQQALLESEAMFRSVAQSSPLGIFTADDHGSTLWVNGQWSEISGLTSQEAVGRPWTRIIHPDDRDVLPGNGDECSFTSRVQQPDGTSRWVTVWMSPIRDRVARGVAVVGLVEDISDRVRAERDTRRLTDIFEATEDLVAIADADGSILYFNRAARQFFDLPLVGPVEGIDPSIFLTGTGFDVLTDRIGGQLAEDGVWNGEITLSRPDGVAVPVLAQVLAHYDSEGHVEFFSGIMRDISVRKAFEHQLAHQATHDPLTGLPNRVLLIDELAVALERGRRHDKSVAVLFLDLDHFKVVNDSLGHSLGDQLLMAIAVRLKVDLRPGDTIARFGGDEFVLMCQDLDGPDDAVAIARRVEKTLAGPFDIHDSEIYVGVSIGIAFADDNTDEPETLIRDADAAMYRAKDRGRARFEVFDGAMRAHAVDRLDIENALRRSIDRRELRVHYQPVIDLGTGAITGVEALLRWEHSERGLLLPDEFITIAEETGLIVPIGGWVLGQACRQLSRWQAETPAASDLIVTVNLSGRQLSHPRLVTEVELVLEETGIDPSRLDLEITESVLMDDVEMSAEMLERLKALGVELAVDDFGTGYSSLSYLRQFPVDVLKIDQSFIAGLGEDSGDSAIVEAIVDLAHTLGLRAVAEGVETPAQLATLRSLGCDQAQGFFMARPLTPEVLLQLVKERPTY